jgi:adenine-specific DNA-methyltransferase
MSALGDLIAQVGDPALRARLEEEARRVLEGRKFGLVFEEHLPDDTLLPGVPVRRGGWAARRGDAGGGLLRVLRVSGGMALCADAAAAAGDGRPPGGTATEIPLGELVAAARPGEPVYPCLEEMDRIGRGGPDAPWHALIEADNAHALQFLQYVCGGMVDCIYVDPPYNTGARDWKYNNDYVDQNDAWRHSKWLSMMKRRLRLAKKLLNPKDSVLIVTIDEKEYLHLGCLLEEMFPEAHMQMVSIVINPNGVARDHEMYRVEEYAFFVYLGEAGPAMLADWLFTSDAAQQKVPSKNELSRKSSVRWERLLRGGLDSERNRAPGCFYPVYIDPQKRCIVEVGDALERGQDRHSVPGKEGLVAVWPISEGRGEEKRWQMTAPSLRKLVAGGFAKVGEYNKKKNRWTLLYLGSKQRERIEQGQIMVTGRDENGVVLVEESGKQLFKKVPKTIWNRQAHSAGEYGSRLLRGILPERNFPFPKSLYAVRDTLKSVVADKPDALIVDFFAGSGTTLHAVNLLNAEDGGRRRCIMVTNNEVSEAEAKAMRERGLQAGDDEWEALGIARHVTWPRTVCSIEGHDVNGAALKGTYLGTELAMSDGFKANAAFYRLSFLDKDSVALGRALEALLPTLWMKSGARGAPPMAGAAVVADGVLAFPENRFAVLTDERAMPRLKEVLGDGVGWTVYLATDDGVAFRAMASGLGGGVRCVQLYRDYLDNFRINRERE